MTDSTRGGLRGTPRPREAGIPIPLVRGHASAEEVSAVVAIVAVLAAVANDDEPGPADGHSQGNGLPTRSAWSAPARLVRTGYPHGPGGWRGSASPR